MVIKMQNKTPACNVLLKSLKMPKSIRQLPVFDKIKYQVKRHIKFLVNEEYTKIRGYIGVSFYNRPAKIFSATFSIVEFENAYKLQHPSALETEAVYQLLEKIILILSQRIYNQIPTNVPKYCARYLIFRPGTLKVKQCKLKNF